MSTWELVANQLAQFLQNLQLETFCWEHSASTLAELHPSFANKDKIAAIIQKQRFLSYPSGQDINGLIFLKNIDQGLNVSTLQLAG